MSFETQTQVAASVSFSRSSRDIASVQQQAASLFLPIFRF